MTCEIVETARRWIGTPYLHQASVEGVGSDCLGLVRGIWRDVLGDEPEIPPAYSKDWGEVGVKDVLHQAALRHLKPKPLDAAHPGDVLLFRMSRGAVAKHLGIQAQVGANPTFIHAYSGSSVIESPLSTPWHAKIVARFTFPSKG